MEATKSTSHASVTAQKPAHVRSEYQTCCVTRYCIDAATLLQLIAEGSPMGEEPQIVAPSMIRSEAISLLFDAVRCGHLNEQTARQHLDLLTELKMRVLGDRVSRRTAWQIESEQGWKSTGGAEYLAVTKLQADALVTVDPVLAEKALGVVPLAAFSALTTSSK